MDPTADGFNRPHRRRNALTGEWVLVSPQRSQRPWQGAVEAPPGPSLSSYDPACYLCPGNRRAHGEHNPSYAGVYVFDNDFPALLPDRPSHPVPSSALLSAAAEQGVCRVVCFSPRHDLALGRMPVREIRGVVDAWCQESSRLGALPYIGWVQIFENRGELMGTSNPHPHCQIWASETIPTEARKELERQAEYRREHGSCLLCDYRKAEQSGPRLVFESASFWVGVPFWAVWPFETLVVSKRHCGSLEELAAAERDDLADALKRLIARYDNLFETPFPYTMGFHQKPCDGEPHESWHMHAHFYPPLLRSASLRKFMVGYEMLAMPQRDITAEAAAERLRACSEVHYLDRPTRGI